MDNIILIDKPKHWSSYDVIRYLKKKNKINKIGHAGTLDPIATGLLVILINQATKKFSDFQKVSKEYEATIRFGQKTDTYDSEGKIIHKYREPFKLKKIEIINALEALNKRTKQIPPKYSAIKIKGKKAYELARKNKELKLEARKIKIYEADILEIKEKEVKIRFVVSSGTYIRSLAHDLGEITGYGAYLKELKRTKIGDLKLENAEKII